MYLSAHMTPGTSSNVVQFFFAEGAAEIEILQAVGGNPDVRFGVVDEHADVGAKSQVNPQLHRDQHHGKRNAGQGHREPNFVVKKVLASNRNHRQAASSTGFYHEGSGQGLVGVSGQPSGVGYGKM